MSLQQTLTAFDALSSSTVNGQKVKALFASFPNAVVEIFQQEDEAVPDQPNWPPTPKNVTDFVSVLIPGSKGKKKGGSAPTLGIIGRLGGIGARPNVVGLVSDADGAIAAIATALKIAQMNANGDVLVGDVRVSTHLCKTAPILQSGDLKYLGMPMRTETMNKHQIHAEMDAIISLDTSKGNRLINERGFAISPTVKEGVILPVAADLIKIMESVSGTVARTFPLSQADITPYHNGLKKFNSIMQPHIGTDKPVVGVAITAQSYVLGNETNASREEDIASCVRFAAEVAQRFTAGACQFFDVAQWAMIGSLYPVVKSMTAFQKTP